MGVLSLFSALGDFFRIQHLSDKAVIDNGVFRAHYKLTAALFFGCSILVTAYSFIGEPINCVLDRYSNLNSIINTYCWIATTFTLTRKADSKVGINAAYPGVFNDDDDKEHVQYHSYYQWVPYVLVIQGLLFYLPHWIWKIWEQGRIQMITEGIRGFEIGQIEERLYAQNRLVRYLINNLNMHNMYALGYFVCEMLNFVNVIANIFLIDSFLGGEFLMYGLNVIKFNVADQDDRYDPMITVFPRMTKCRFNKYGPSGTIQTHDALCLLAVNNLNEKIYIALWFWLLILFFISGFTLLYSMALCALPRFRKLILCRRFKYGTTRSVSKLINRLQIGDFLLLHFLGQNMDYMQFNQMMTDFNSRLHMVDGVPIDISNSNQESIPMDINNHQVVEAETQA